jgi:hypothetical protein
MLATFASAVLLSTLAAASPIAPTVEIAPGVSMPRINLGTCCGSKVSSAFPAWYIAGGRGVDTAFDYGKEVPGGKETDLGKAIVKAGAQRSSLFITTKIRAGLDILHGGKLCLGLSAEYALKAVQADLKELNVSQVDLVLLHAPCTSDATNLKLWKGMEQGERYRGFRGFPSGSLEPPGPLPMHLHCQGIPCICSIWSILSACLSAWPPWLRGPVSPRHGAGAGDEPDACHRRLELPEEAARRAAERGDDSHRR